MKTRRSSARYGVVALLAAFIAGASTSGSVAADTSPVNVGLIASKTGLLGAYGLEFSDGFRVGLDYATHGTGMANGHKIVVAESDDASDSAKAVATAKDLIGQNVKIIVSAGSSGTALQLAPLAKENRILYVSGAAATDALTGANRNTFRSGRQTYQDVVAAGAILGSNLRGKTVLVLAQDTVFGQANVAAARSVLGAEGAAISGLLVPLSANDFTPFAQKVLDAKPSLLYIAWAGATGPAMFKSLADANVFASTPAVTGLDQRSQFALFGSAGAKINFISHYFYEAAPNPANAFLVKSLQSKDRKDPEIFDDDGFVAAQMVVHAIEKANGTNEQKLIASLEGWSFVGPKGEMQNRAADHAMLQPMFIARLVRKGETVVPRLVRTLPAEMLAPPVQAIK